MTKRLLEATITEHLSGVELDARSPTKFALVARAVADALAVESARIAVKRIKDIKNYGNRISEATGVDLDVLVLLADEDVDRSAVRRALETRALRIVPTLLVVGRPTGWMIELQFLPPESTPSLSEAPVVYVSRDVTPVLDEHGSSRIAESILALRGPTTEGELQAQLTALASRFPSVVLKQVPDQKNLKNRVREASGRRPGHLVLSVPEAMCDSARSELRAVAENGVTACFMVWMKADRAYVEAIDDHAERASPPTDVSRAALEAPEKEQLVESEDLTYRRLERVKQIHRYLPLNANGANLYEESLSQDQRLRYETKTLGYLRKLLASERRCVIVLTGNAGHGKTHMCCRLVEGSTDATDVMATLRRDKEGRRAWTVPSASFPIRIIKDLSELEPPERAAGMLSELCAQETAHVLVCANEGRLRDVVTRARETLDPILEALDRGLEHGDTNPATDDSIHVINLNFQAAVAADGGFLKHVLTQFLDNQAAWNVCTKCRAHPECPILGNRMALTLSPSADRENRHARQALTDLVRIAEESGYVLTYRETLVLVAYLVTGGLTCEEVEVLHRDGRRRDRLRNFALLDLLFDVPLSEDRSEILGVLKRIKRLDPGRIALRPVDEELHRHMEAQGRFGAGVFGEDSVQLRNRRDLDREVEEYRRSIRDARRTAWLQSSETDEQRLGVSRSERLGLSSHHVFRTLQAAPSPSEHVDILRRLVKGLHTIQGAVNVESKTSLHLVDPAFGRSGSHSAVIARSLRIRDLELWPESRWWRERRAQRTPPILESVEWTDRRILLVNRADDDVLLSLDLATFEFVMSSADGVVMREFNAGDRRRVLARLALHAEKGRRNAADEIRVLLERGDGKLTVERDGTILLERTS